MSSVLQRTRFPDDLRPQPGLASGVRPHMISDSPPGAIHALIYTQSRAGFNPFGQRL